MLRISVVGVCLLSGGAGRAVGQDEAAELDASATVLIRVYRDRGEPHSSRNTIGTGFFIRGPGIPKGTILTCYSLIRDAALIRARLAPNADEFVSANCDVVVTDPVHDVALLRLSAPIETHGNPLALATENLPHPTTGDDLLIVEPPSSGAKGRMHRGTLLALSAISQLPSLIREEQKLPSIDDPINEAILYEVETTWSSATSGAPVVHADTGHVIAILWFSAHAPVSTNRQRYYCIPAGYVGNLDFAKLTTSTVKAESWYRNRELPESTLQAANESADTIAGSETLGTISPSTYLQYADDYRAFHPFEERGQWNIFAEGPYTEFANKKYHFGILVPTRTKIGEEYDVEASTFSARYQTPEDRTLTLTSRILPRQPKSPRGELLRQLTAYRRHALELEVVGSEDEHDGFRGTKRVIFGHFLNHDIYQLGPNYFRTLRHFHSLETSTSYVLLASISGDIFTTIHFEFPTSEWRPNAELPLLRQCFIAASLSSIAWESR